METTFAINTQLNELEIHMVLDKYIYSTQFAKSGNDLHVCRTAFCE
jgi:hypothetical protein